MNKIEFFKNVIFQFFPYGLNNIMSQEDILGLAISLILDQFSILCDFN